MCRNNMGLGGVEKMENLESYSGNPNPLETDHDQSVVGMSELDICTSKLAALGTGDNSSDMQLLLQAQVLLNKSDLYQKITESLRGLWFFQPNVFNNVPQASTEKDKVNKLHRDAAVNNLRFINIFYGFGPKTFALAVNLLDRLLGKVKTHPRYLSCIATCCFYIAAKTQEDVFIPDATELVKLSQCGGTVSDLIRMESLILDKLSWELNAVTPLTFLQLFYEVLTVHEPKMADQTILNSVIRKLEVIMCQFEFTQYRSDVVALALLSYELQELGILKNAEQFNSVVELQYYCQMSDGEFLHCRGMVMDYLRLYTSQQSKLPRLQLTWTVSRRTLNKMKPSTRILLDLEPIMEDEDDPDSDDAGPFDSENDDIDIVKNNYAGVAHDASPKQTQLEISRRNNKMTMCPLEDKCAELSFMLHSEEENM